MDPIEEDPRVLLPLDSSSGSDGGDVDGEYIISSLPDSILCHILSKLPTKYAVGTSILSSQWRHLFPSIPNPRIDIDDTHLLHPPTAADGDPHQPVRNTHFINFIHHLLNVALRDVQFSHLSLHFHHDYGNTTIKELVSAASRYQVSHLYLEFTVNDCGISLDDLRNFALLESLALIQKCVLHVPNSLKFQNLTEISLHSATFNQSDGLERALNACPLLEDLCLDLCRFPESEVVRISLPNLKMLLIFHCSHYDSFELEIHTPILEYFNYSDAVAEGYSLVDFSSLLRAHIQLGLSNVRFEEEDDHSIYSENVAQMIRACYNVTHLYLARTSISNSYNVIHPLPIYQNLIELSLGNLCGTGWELLPHLLQNSPNLEALIFEKGIEDHEGCYSRFESCLPDSVPNCLSSRLLKIKFEEFKGEEDELKLVKYFLRTAAVLIEMRVCLLLSLPMEELKRIWSSVKAIPRRSRKCWLHYM